MIGFSWGVGLEVEVEVEVVFVVAQATVREQGKERLVKVLVLEGWKKLQVGEGE